MTITTIPVTVIRWAALFAALLAAAPTTAARAGAAGAEPPPVRTRGALEAGGTAGTAASGKGAAGTGTATAWAGPTGAGADAAPPPSPPTPSAPAARGCAAGRCWPVAGPGPRGRPLVLRMFDPPATPWAAGHRGVDLRAGPGAPVRAAAAGEVAFSGPVGGVPVVVVRLPGGLRTTYEPVRGALPAGTPVASGERLGVLAGGLPHCPGPCLHWGLLSGDTYLDPLTLLPSPLLRSEPSRLLPLPGDARSRVDP